MMVLARVAILATAMLIAATPEVLAFQLPKAQSAPPEQQQRIPTQLEPAVQAPQKRDPEAALSLARKFVKSQPALAAGPELLAAAAIRARQWRAAEQALL